MLNMQRMVIGLGLILAIALAWVLSAPADPLLRVAPPAPADDPAATSTPTGAPLPPAPPASGRDQGLDGAWWTEALTAPDGDAFAAADDDSRAVVLRGRLTVRQQPWRHPADIEIRITRSWLDSVVPVETAPDQRVPQRDEPRTRTDDRGYFAFRLLPAATDMFFLIGHGTEWSDYQKVPRLPRRGQELDLGDVFVDQRGSIVGRVTKGARENLQARAVDDPLLDGNSGMEDVRQVRAASAEWFRSRGTLRHGPVPNWVAQRDRYLPFPTATVQRDGSLRLDHVRPGNHDVIVSNEQGKQYGIARGILVAAGRTTDIGDVALRSCRPVTLRFVDQDGRPWVGANISFVHEKTGFGSVAVRTDAAGTACAFLPEPEAHMLVFGLPGGGPCQTLPWQPNQDTTIVVPRPDALVVALADASGSPLPGGRVRCYVRAALFRPVDRALPPAMQPTEQSPGRHVGVLPCPLVVVASVRGFAPAIAEVDGAAPLALKLLPLQRMTVHVHNRRGEPIANATVRAQAHANPDSVFPGSAWAALANDRVTIGMTDERGELTVPVWPTFFSFQARHPDFPPSAGPKVMATPGGRYELLMQGGGDLVGTLTIETRPAPRGMRVRARQRPPDTNSVSTSGFLDSRIAVTGAGGTFEFRELIAGNWELVPELPPVPSPDGSRPSGAFAPVQVQLDEGQERHVVLAAQQDVLAPAQIRGTVTKNGATVPDALVRVRELEPPDMQKRNEQRRKTGWRYGQDADAILGPVEGVPWRSRCTTDSFGDFCCSDLVAGSEYEVRVDIPHQGRLQFVARRVVRAGSTARPLQLDFAVPTNLVQLACTKGSAAFGNRMIRLRQVLPGGTDGACFELLLDDFGRADVDGLPLGAWTIEPMHGGRFTPGEFELMPGPPRLLQFECDRPWR